MILHALPAFYTVDGVPGVQQPRGLHANRLAVDIHVVAADAAPFLRALCVLFHGLAHRLLRALAGASASQIGRSGVGPSVMVSIAPEA